MKRVLTIQDISCVGRCSLTVALPVLSAMGLETAVLPTALLSAHTAFEGVYKRDLTEVIVPVTEHWHSQGICFSSVSCGYLSSDLQMELVKDCFGQWRKEGALFIIDPVMGDHGKLYTGFDGRYVRCMREFCREADVLLPNLTEAAFLTGIDYSRLPGDKREYEDMARRLAGLHGGTVIVKGISLKEGRISVLAHDARTEETVWCERERLAAQPSGTGDIFAAVCQGAFTKGAGLYEAVELAMDFVSECIRRTCRDEESRWYGVNFEEALSFLIGREKR